MRAIVIKDFINSRPELGESLPDVLQRYFVPLSSDGNLQDLNSFMGLAAGLALNLRPNAEIKRIQIWEWPHILGQKSGMLSSSNFCVFCDYSKITLFSGVKLDSIQGLTYF